LQFSCYIRHFSEYGKPRFATFLKYGKSELTPPSPTELPAAFAAAAKLVQSGVTMQWRNLTVKEAWLNTLVATEVVCWFFVGECIGKGSLVAYKV
jgi:F-type H+-transporting ATPase subunit g